MGKILRDQAGLTLVELIIGLVIGTIVIVGIISAIITARKSSNFNFNQNYNVLEAKKALTQITDALRCASPASGEIPALNATTANASFAVNGLSRRIYRITTGTNANNVVIDFYNSMGAVSETRTIARTVNSLTFTRNSSSSLNMVIGVGNTANSQNPAMNSSTTITMPNFQ